MQYFTEKKAILTEERPDLAPNELTKYAMGKFKQLYGGGTLNATDTETNGKENGKSSLTSAKRKITPEGNGRSGVAKLAKFAFNKQ